MPTDPRECLRDRVDLVVVFSVRKAKEFSFEAVKPGRILGEQYRARLELYRDPRRACLLIALRINSNDLNILRS